MLVNGCFDDGTQFYGEKCGGSDFGALNEEAFGACGPSEEICACKLYTTTDSPGCFAIATPELFAPAAVFWRADGCVAPETETTEPAGKLNNNFRQLKEIF